MAVVVYYHTACKVFTARAEAAVLMLEYAGKKYECKEPKECPQTFPVLAPPMLGIHNTVVGQSQAINIALGKELGLCPQNAMDEAHAIQISLNTEDILGDLSKGPERLQKWLDLTEKSLDIAGSGYVVGKTLSFADFTAFMGLGMIAEVAPGLIDKMPKCSAFMKMVGGLKGVKEFKAKGIPLMPPKKPKSKM